MSFRLNILHKITRVSLQDPHLDMYVIPTKLISTARHRHRYLSVIVVIEVNISELSFLHKPTTVTLQPLLLRVTDITTFPTTLVLYPELHIPIVFSTFRLT